MENNPRPDKLGFEKLVNPPDPGFENPPPYTEIEYPSANTLNPIPQPITTPPVFIPIVLSPQVEHPPQPQISIVENHDAILARPLKPLLIDADNELRNLFFRKVYGIMTVQTAIICGIISILIYVPSFKEHFIEMGFFKFYGCWIAGIIVSTTATAFARIMRKPPMHIVLLAMTTFSTAVLLGTLAARLHGQEGILICMGIIGSVCLSVVLFTFQRKFYYTAQRSIFVIWTLLLLPFGVLCGIYPVSTAAYLLIGPTVFCTYLCVTTQLAIQNEKLALRTNEICYGAVKISMFLLALIGEFFLCFFEACTCCGTREVRVRGTTVVISA